MARVLVTGSSDGLGLSAGLLLLQEGHEVTFHARNEGRAVDLRRAVPGGGPTVVIGDLASLEQTRSVAAQANLVGRHDAVIHNAGIGYRRPVALAFAMARRWPDVLSNAVEPGWVATKMGGPGAPDDLAAAPVTQCWLAVSQDREATATGGYWYHQRRRDAHPATTDPRFQDKLTDRCASLSGVLLPG